MGVFTEVRNQDHFAFKSTRLHAYLFENALSSVRFAPHSPFFSFSVASSSACLIFSRVARCWDSIAIPPQLLHARIYVDLTCPTGACRATPDLICATRSNPNWCATICDCAIQWCSWRFHALASGYRPKLNFPMCKVNPARPGKPQTSCLGGEGCPVEIAEAVGISLPRVRNSSLTVTTPPPLVSSFTLI